MGQRQIDSEFVWEREREREREGDTEFMWEREEGRDTEFDRQLCSVGRAVMFEVQCQWFDSSRPQVEVDKTQKPFWSSIRYVQLSNNNYPKGFNKLCRYSIRFCLFI